MNSWLLTLLIVYPTIGLIAGFFLLLLDKDLNFDAPNKSWKSIFTDWRTYVALAVALIAWPVALIIFIISLIRDKGKL